jgi:hypothetical protein
MDHRSVTNPRRFGLSVGGVFLLLGTLSRYRGHELPPLVLWTVGAGLVVPGAIAPRFLVPVERAWMRFAAALGHVNGRIILGVFYYLFFSPLALLRRLVRDPLDRRLEPEATTHWTARPAGTADAKRYEQQF